MKVKPKQEILFYDGSPIKNPDTKTAITVKELIVQSINTAEEGDSGEDKMRAFDISMRMYSDKEVDLSVEDMNFILKKAEKVLVPVAYGRLKEIFND